MTIKTLERIHKMLVFEEDNYLFLLKESRKRQYDAENSGSQDAEKLKREADEIYKIHSEVMDALQDFENQDWR